MIPPEYIDPSALPALPLASKKQLPEIPCIYFAIDSLGHVQYIGRSINLKSRWLKHHKHKDLSAIGGVRIAWLEVNDSSLLDGIEAALIEHFNPPLNGRVRLFDIPSVKPSGRGMIVEKTIYIEAPGLGDQIKEARKMSDKSLKSLAQSAGMSQMNWYRIEKEEQIVPIETLRKIEAVLGVDFGVED